MFQRLYLCLFFCLLFASPSACNSSDPGKPNAPQNPNINTNSETSPGSDPLNQDGAQADRDTKPPALDAAQLASDGAPPNYNAEVCRISIDCDGKTIKDEPKIICAIRLESENGILHHEGAVAIEKRGRSSQSFPKPQYSMELRLATQTDVEQPRNLLDMGLEADWVLNGAYIDRSLIRNRVLYKAFGNFAGDDHYAADSVFCTLKLDGAKKGIYLLTERIKRGPHRINISRDRKGDGESFILKQDDSTGLQKVSTANGNWNLIYPTKSKASQEQKTGIGAYLDKWVAVIKGSDTETDLFSLIDLDSAVDYVLIQEFAKNNDAYFLSMHIWKPANGLIHFSPWDLDLSFGQPTYANNVSPESWIGYRPQMISKMAQNKTFQSRIASRWQELRKGTMSNAAIMERVDFHLKTIAPYVADNFKIWPIGDIEFVVSQVDSLPSVASYDDEIAKIRAWIPKRLKWMDENVANYVTK